MSESIKINTDRLRSDAADIKKHIEGIKKELEDLKEKSIKGDEEFPAEILEEAIQSLEAMNEYEINAAQKYEECERKVGDLVNQIKI